MELIDGEESEDLPPFRNQLIPFTKKVNNSVFKLECKIKVKTILKDGCLVSYHSTFTVMHNLLKCIRWRFASLTIRKEIVSPDYICLQIILLDRAS